MWLVVLIWRCRLVALWFVRVVGGYFMVVFVACLVDSSARRLQVGCCYLFGVDTLLL